MKNYILFFALLLCATSATTVDDNQYEGLQITLSIYNNDVVGNETNPRTPVRTPVVYQSEQTLYFYSECENSVIEIKDENGLSVYRATISDVPESLIIPEDLSGTYEIRIIRGNITFFGYIEL